MGLGRFVPRPFGHLRRLGADVIAAADAAGMALAFTGRRHFKHEG